MTTTEATPGQAAYEANAAMVVPRPWRWDQLDGKLRAAWEAAAQAAIDCYNDNRADWPNEADLAEIAGREAAKAGLPPGAAAIVAQAAPELSEAMAETRAIRDADGQALFTRCWQGIHASTAERLPAQLWKAMTDHDRSLWAYAVFEASLLDKVIAAHRAELAEVRRIAYQGGRDGESVRRELLAWLEANGGING